MKKEDIAQWMLDKLTNEESLYQDDVVDFLIKKDLKKFLVENTNGNKVLSRPLLNLFNKITKDNVVWVRSELYWRFRVPEDEEGRIARG